MLLEIACFDIASAIKAAAAGADRIELCDNAAEGGTTPSYGTLKRAKEKLAIPVFPIIRPRGGDFFYTDDEYKTMLYDVQMCKDLGFDGAVFGLLNNDGTIDVKRTTELVKVAGDMPITFHRAFDRCIHPLQALEDIINCGCKRILTSGQMPYAFDGKNVIKQLIDKAESRISIMPGSGVRNNNIAELARFTGAKELHSSARKMLPSAMQYINENIEETNEIIGVDEDEIIQMKQALQSVYENAV